jgi:hypothetical protein
MNGLFFVKTASWKLSTMENPYSQNYRFSEHLVKLDDQTTYLKTFLDGRPVCITINNSGSIMNHARKNETVTFW